MRAPFVVGALLALGLRAGAQSPGARADSAWETGERDAARRLYAQARATNPHDSHSVFRLAQLTADREQALRLYQEYTRLEPNDAWGWMAVGDALAKLSRTREALRMYDRAEQLRPAERDVAIGRARVLSRGGRSGAAGAEYERWAAGHPADREAWREAGREWSRAGKPERASRALERAVAAGAGNAQDQLRTARAAAAPTLEPVVGYTRDSDGNRTSRVGLRAEWAAGDGNRLGLAGSVAGIGDGIYRHRIEEGALRLGVGAGRTRATLSAGAARLERGTAGSPWLTPTAEARLRWRDTRGTLLDLRVQRLPLGATPLLVENRGMRNEARATVQVPLGPIRVRASGRLGSIRVLDQNNTRWSGDGAVAIPLGWRGEISVQYHRLHYQRPSNLGYFAPDQVETIEGGTYTELAGRRASLAFDLGSGMQRLQEFGAGTGPWRFTLRAWGYLAVPFAPGRELRLELEGYDAPFAPEGVTTSGHWRFISVSAGARWAFR